MAMGRNRSQANRTHDAKATLVHEITVCSFRSGIVSTNFSGNWASRRWLFQDKCPQGISWAILPWYCQKPLLTNWIRMYVVDAIQSTSIMVRAGSPITKAHNWQYFFENHAHRRHGMNLWCLEVGKIFLYISYICHWHFIISPKIFCKSFHPRNPTLPSHCHRPFRWPAGGPSGLATRSNLPRLRSNFSVASPRCDSKSSMASDFFSWEHHLFGQKKPKKNKEINMKRKNNK